MARQRVVMWLGMWAMSMALQAQALKPQDDLRVTSTRVLLAETVPVPCVVVAARSAEATIVFSQDELEGLAAVRTRVDDSEPARLAFIAGMRARDLLGQLGPQRDARGCRVVQGTVSMEAGFLVGQLLERGHATVFTRRLNLPEPMIEIRDVNTPVSGWREFHLLDGTMIWSYSAWVS